MSISLKTRDEIDIRNAIRSEFVTLAENVIDFIAAKTAEGWTMADLNEMYAIELPLAFGYLSENGRIRVSYPV